MPREEHFEIIKKRTARMLKSGLIEEVDHLLQQGFTGDEKPLQSIGYKEVLELKSGLIESLEACEERINISTRQLAKSQRTWFNRLLEKHTFHPLNQRSLISETLRKFLA